jgi:phage gpG-like protein
MAKKFDFASKIKKFEALKKSLPTVVGNMAVNHFKDSFRLGGFVDEAFRPWPKRKPGSRRNAGRATLVNRGHLRRSISLKEKNFTRTRISSEGLVYADVHNRGLRAGRGRGFRMPKRKFMGNSKKLERDMRKKINEKIKAIF